MTLRTPACIVLLITAGGIAVHGQQPKGTSKDGSDADGNRSAVAAGPNIAAAAVKVSCAGRGIPTKTPAPPRDDVFVELDNPTFAFYYEGNGPGSGLVFEFYRIAGGKKDAPKIFSVAASTANKSKTGFNLPAGQYELVIHARNPDGSAGSSHSPVYPFKLASCP